MNPSLGELNVRNLSAWDALYASTGELIWGEAEVGFLATFLAPEKAAGRNFRRALDAGTGEGRNLPGLLRLAEEVSACDGAAAALAKIAPDVAQRVRLEHCELATTPFADGSFDFILLCDTIETLPDPAPVLRELRRVLAPGGCLLCNIPGPEGDVAGTDMTMVGDAGFLYRQRYFYRFFHDEAARELLAATGWRVIRDELVAWREAPHPGFRPEEHDHRSRIYLLGAVAEYERHG